MRLKDTLRTLMASAGTALMAASCSVDVDLCTDPFHPHSAEVSYGFSFADGTAAPDSMFIIANRVVARRVSAMTVSSATGRGYFVQGAIEGINEPEEPAPGDSSGGDTPPEDIEISTEGGGEGQPGGSDASVGGAASSRQAGLPDSSPGDDLDGEGDPSGGTDAGGDASAEEPADQSLASFRLPVGDYRFMAFNMDTTELIYDDVMAYLAGDGAMGMGELCVDYRTYSKDDPELRKALPAWQDYNPYAGFMQPDMRPLLVDTVAASLAQGQRLACRFAPGTMSQNVDIYFTITKKADAEPFVVDSVMGEISGLPVRINLARGDLDISRTCKMMFRTGLVAADGPPLADSYAAQSVRCHANIDVPGIVPGSAPDVSTGPGIMQVIIFVHAANPADPSAVLTKKIQGKINLYNTLREARLTDYTDDGMHVRRTAEHGVLDINAELVIDGETIIENADNEQGIDSWLPCDDIVVDI